MVKSLEFDGFVVAAIQKAKLNLPEWQSELPLNLRSKVVAIVEAPNWNELPDAALTRMDFLKYQMTIADFLKAIAKVGSVGSLVLMVWPLNTIDQLTLGADDSVTAASIRLGAICFFPLTIWSTWNSWKKGGAFFQLQDACAGFSLATFPRFG